MVLYLHFEQNLNPNCHIKTSDLFDRYKYIFLLSGMMHVLLCTPGLLSGQQIRTKEIKSEAAISYNYLEEFNLYFTGYFTFKKHEPFIGFEFPVSSNHVTNYGINVGYKFYPNKIRQVFDLYFVYLIQADSRNLYSNSTISGFSLHNLMGYGFNIYFNDILFVNHQIAAGIEKSCFGNEGSFTDLSLLIKIGIGLKIKTIGADK